MREIFEMCVRLDSLAVETYDTLATHCADEELAALFATLSREERTHVIWWSNLLDAWNLGLIPDIVPEPRVIAATLARIHEDIVAVIPPDVATLSPHEMIEIAARFEFFMLDSIFGELLELTEPGRTGAHREAYSHHVGRIVQTIERSPESGSLSRFLARVLTRSLRDNLALATHAVRDAQTGLFNRRAFIAHLKQWVAWASRYDHPLAVILIDVDRFKEINDRLGHAAGDAALGCIARSLRASTRESDLLARYGGDEFAIIAPECDAAEYESLAERVLQSARATECFAPSGERIALSVSVGGGILLPGTNSDERTSDALIAAADMSMYAAKSAGRDGKAPPRLLAHDGGSPESDLSTPAR